MLRLFYLTSLAKWGLGRSFPHIDLESFMEHPRDPAISSSSPNAHRCSSIWATRAYIRWAHSLGHRLLQVDQCRLGQVVTKPTSFSTTLPLDHWHDLYCNHGKHEVSEDLKSSDLSRYPAQLMQDLAAAIIATAGKSILLYPPEMQPQPTKKPRMEPSRAATTRGHPTPEGLGLATTAALATITPATANHTPAWHTLLEKSQAIPATLQVAVQDPVLMMQAAFRCRLIQDGGGKPSPGRLTPPHRPLSPLASKGVRIMALLSSWVEPIQWSIQQTDKTHPLPTQTRVHQTHPGPD